MFDFLGVVMSFLPLRIKRAEWDSDYLVISGDNWSFSSCSAWRMSQSKVLLFACWDDQANISINELVGLSVESVSWITSDLPIDPSFFFSDGRRLDVFCTSVFDPWVMNLPNGNVYVGGA